MAVTPGSINVASISINTNNVSSALKTITFSDSDLDVLSFALDLRMATTERDLAGSLSSLFYTADYDPSTQSTSYLTAARDIKKVTFSMGAVVSYTSNVPAGDHRPKEGYMFGSILRGGTTIPFFDDEYFRYSLVGGEAINVTNGTAERRSATVSLYDIKEGDQIDIGCNISIIGGGEVITVGTIRIYSFAIEEYL